MTIIKLITKYPVLHPKPTREVYLNRGFCEMEAYPFGVVITLSQPNEHPIVVPWSNVAEVAVDNADDFMEEVDPSCAVPEPPPAPSDPAKKTRAKK